jgi:hypothetical protein
MTSPGTERLTRDLQPMPQFVRTALRDRRLMIKYQERPAYQRNDYLMWINEAKREETKMLDELASGGVYMGMRWNGGE